MQQDHFASRLVRAGLNVLTVITLACLAIVAWMRLPTLLARAEQQDSTSNVSTEIVLQAAKSAGTDNQPTSSEYQLAPISLDDASVDLGVMRRNEISTIIPNRPRVDVISYTVESGDNLFSIAEKYNLKPETILWGNYETLNDNPQMLSTGQVLNILPTDGTYYEWNQGDNLANIASFFGVDTQAILDYPGNRIDLTAIASSGDAGIEAGKWLIIPGGHRVLKDWGPPAISRANPAAARYYGDGYCGAIYEGAIGTGTFVWPTTAHSISGYGYSGIHPAIDIAGALGNAVFAADNGVVVFSGWSNYGYGYMVVIDHGNGWQTAYAHLSAVGVTCGQSVFQGGYIGALGSSGNSSGPHLHFEMVYNGAKPNPLDYVQ
jgi:murein DD-endopeptidase MepM/ murein hydrolase activator NlpD